MNKIALTNVNNVHIQIQIVPIVHLIEYLLHYVFVQ